MEKDALDVVAELDHELTRSRLQADKKKNICRLNPAHSHSIEFICHKIADVNGGVEA